MITWGGGWGLGKLSQQMQAKRPANRSMGSHGLVEDLTSKHTSKGGTYLALAVTSLLCDFVRCATQPFCWRHLAWQEGCRSAAI